jgi:hypothetical protein
MLFATLVIGFVGLVAGLAFGPRYGSAQPVADTVVAVAPGPYNETLIVTQRGRVFRVKATSSGGSMQILRVGALPSN